jgi:hypothetical protein
MLAYKIQMPGNYPEESIQHSEHGESLKSRNLNVSGARELPRRKQTKCGAWWKFEIKKLKCVRPRELPRRKRTTFRTMVKV